MKNNLILIIDDNEDDFFSLSRMVNPEYQALYSNGTDDIIELIEKNTPQCILLDYHLGEIKGIELLTEIKAKIKTEEPPVIMLTGEKNTAIVIDCMKSGAIDYFVKGEHDKFHILKTIGNSIEKANLQNKVKKQQAELKVSYEELAKKTNILQKQKIAIAEKNNELEKTSRYKSEFLSNISHELRTPLNSILILSKDLVENRENNLFENQVQSAHTIYNSGNDLLTRINDILDLSKIEAGRIEVQVSKIDKSDIFDFLKLNFKYLAEKKQLEFQIKTADNFPDYIYSDQQKLNQILINLMSNAIKFTHKGMISVSMAKVSAKAVLAKLETKKAIAISVIDTGIGIAKDKMSKIFESFQQADPGISQKYGGTGLGLAISKKLAELLGGFIDLESSEKKGSEFTLYIPEKLLSS